MKQTAVEWLKEQIECFGNKHELQMSWDTLDELLEQALELEKQQIEDAYVDGFKECEKIHEEAFFIQDLSEKYYNETYKKD
jgi:hypothetical protein